jgi:hypothetical protein
MTPQAHDLTWNQIGSEGLCTTRKRQATKNLTGNPANAPRCGAKTRTGGSCLAPAMKNSRGIHTRCRLHGGASTGPRTPEGLQRCKMARWVHGERSAEAILERKLTSERFRWREDALTVLVLADQLPALIHEFFIRLEHRRSSAKSAY